MDHQPNFCPLDTHFTLRLGNHTGISGRDLAYPPWTRRAHLGRLCLCSITFTVACVAHRAFLPAAPGGQQMPVSSNRTGIRNCSQSAILRRLYIYIYNTSISCHFILHKLVYLVCKFSIFILFSITRSVVLLQYWHKFMCLLQVASWLCCQYHRLVYGKIRL